MRHRLIKGAIALLLVIAAVTWFLQNYEQVEMEVETDVAEAVRTNPLIAAERFLTANGYDATSVSGRQLLDELPAASDTLVINNLFHSLSAAREEALLAWVENGGHLVITPRKSWTQQEKSGYRLLDRLGIHRHGSDFSLFGISADILAGDESISFHFPGIQEPLEAQFRSTTWLHSDKQVPDFAIPKGGVPSPDAESVQSDGEQSDPEYHLVQLTYGSGRVTVTSDNRFLTNDFIGEYDHAWLLSLLTDSRGKVWLLYDKSMPSLWNLLVEHTSPLLVAAALLLCLVLWYSMRRLGPLLQPVENRRRDLVEHLDATSRFFWRNGDLAYVTRATQQLVLDYWKSQHACLLRMREKEQADWISNHSGLACNEVELALFRDVETREQLTRQAQLIQLLRLRIHRG
ncbi:MAG: DUF4350 domain-containing protein [Sedimenticolaceae bacterium]|nr:DUF4350 domain-containing protein [Sedimenticolaceae bacterium]